jgi:hypothetical protein
VLLLLVYHNTSNEHFKSDYSDYTSIDRIKIEKDSKYILDKTNQYSFDKHTSDDMYAYCIGGKPTCLTGSPMKSGTYGNGTSYRSICDDGSNIICNNVISSNVNATDICDNFIWTTPNNIPILFSNIYKGFTTPTNYIPAVINNNSINLYDKNDNIIDTIDKCSVLGVNENICKKALSIPFPITNENPRVSGTDKYDAGAINKEVGYVQDLAPVSSSLPASYTQFVAKSNGKSGMYPSFPCIADYGASPGDNVCNGEIGLIQDNTLICPYHKPICSGYRCDSKFGTCVASG